jgi:AcrR family transcriptional regulator
MSGNTDVLPTKPSTHGASPDQVIDELVTGDGRVARRERNRSAVLDAVVELFEAGNTEPAVEDVSDLSGVSSRSIYRYFHHRDELVRAAMWHLMARVETQMPLADIGKGSLDEAVDRAARRSAHSLDLTSEEFEAGQLVLREQFLDQFAPEFSTLSGQALMRAVVAAELAFQFESFEYLYTSWEGNLDEVGYLLGRQLRIHLGGLR